jgi:hypothetical protein
MKARTPEEGSQQDGSDGTDAFKREQRQTSFILFAL